MDEGKYYFLSGDKYYPVDEFVRLKPEDITDGPVSEPWPVLDSEISINIPVFAKWKRDWILGWRGRPINARRKRLRVRLIRERQRHMQRQFIQALEKVKTKVEELAAWTNAIK